MSSVRASLGARGSGRLLWILAILLLASGCFGHAKPGEEVHYKRNFNFYMATSAGGYVNIDETDYPRILTGAEWDLGEGLEMVEHDLSLAPTEVSWTRYETRYTAEGAKLTVDVTVRVADDAQPGWSGIRLKLPGLLEFARATNTGAQFPNEGPGFTINEGFTVAGVTIE